ncbi:yjeF N-terminal domain-containing protein 3 isoform X2 [Dendrobates tinctorius]|uniref:yjeF N-terminal domain-containing protein 3 isoform X2 n=1 Tax=Dendrobates tinctorius TaxID=92724 RepID=UPI003CC97810
MSNSGFENKDGQEPLKYISKQEAEALERELLEDYRFGKQQLIEILGHSCAMAVTKVYPLKALPKKQPTVLIICGPEQNGAIGLVCARNLRAFVQLINDAYNFVVDAVLGVEEDMGELKEPWATILATMKQIKMPIISLDIPSGWDIEAGNFEGINPEVLISLSAPKMCATHFSGKHHFIAGRFLPYDIQKKFDLNLPKYPGTEYVMEL